MRVSSAFCLYIFSKTTQDISFYIEHPVIFLYQIVFLKFIWRWKFVLMHYIVQWTARGVLWVDVKTIVIMIIYNDTLAARVLGSSPCPTTLNVSHYFECGLIFNLKLITYAFFLFLESLLSGGELPPRSFRQVSEVTW